MTDRPLNATGGVAALHAPREAAVSDFIALMKPRVMSLVVFTGFAGLIVAPGSIHPVIAAIAVLCIAVATGASGAINMWFERDLDAKMERTKDRPLPAGRMEPEAALAFGVVLAGGSVMVMALGVNYVAAAILALAIGFYVFVYTIWLKPRTPLNIVIGGAAGAAPPLIVDASLNGSIGLMSVVLFSLVFLWTPPHFWAISLFRKAEYESAGFPMLPITHGEEAARWRILLYALSLAPPALVPVLTGHLSLGYGAVALAVNGWFSWKCVLLLRQRSNKAARSVMLASLVYLHLICTAMTMDLLVYAGN